MDYIGFTDKYPSNEFCTTTSTSNGNPNNCGLESVTMSCDLSYRGNLAPTLEWQQDGNTITSTVKNHTNGLITSSIHLQKGQFETAKYTCRVKYNPSAKTRFIWSSSENMTREQLVFIIISLNCVYIIYISSCDINCIRLI